MVAGANGSEGANGSAPRAVGDSGGVAEREEGSAAAEEEDAASVAEVGDATVELVWNMRH